MPLKPLTIAVLSGGSAAERAISLRSGAAVARACLRLGHRVQQLDPARDLGKLIRKADEIDVIFPALHGRGGEDGSLTGLFELLGLPFVGSQGWPAWIAFGKYLTKLKYKTDHLPVARDCLLTSSTTDPEQQVLHLVGLPCFVKPANEGSSYGASPVRHRSELMPALSQAHKYDSEVLVEELVDGTEISVGVLEDESGQPVALPIAEIRPRTKSGWFDLEAKYSGAVEEIVPAQISTRLTRTAQELAIRAHRVLGLRHLSRTDMLIRGQNIYLLETNVMPGFTEASLLPQMAAAAGINFEQLVQRLLLAALGKNQAPFAH